MYGQARSAARPGAQAVYPFGFTNHQQPQPHGHTPHHPQADPSSHVNGNANLANGALLNHNHHASYAANVSVLQGAQHFVNPALQNGHGVRNVAQQPQHITEHWAEQLRLHKESERANATMTEQHQPHYYARLRASENKGIAGPPPNANGGKPGDDTDDMRRPLAVEKSTKRQDWNNLDLSGQGLRNLAPALFHYEFLQELFIASNKISVLPASIGRLRQLRWLDASHNQLTNLPVELGMCTYLKKLLLFDNHIRDLPNELGALHQLEQLGIEGNPLLGEYKQLIMEKGTNALVTSLRENMPIPMPPPPRAMITIQEDVSTSLERIKVFTWNVLCDKYATPQTYGYTPSNALSWDYRKQVIFEEIQEQNADFLCLQEISTEAFKEDFSPQLAQYDYKGVQWPKSRAKTMPEKDALGVDGCAVFWKNSKFILLDKQLIEFASIAINRPDMKNQHDVFNRVMPRDNIAVICFLESRVTGARLILVNVHLTWDSALADVKTIQTGIMMEHVTKLAEKYARWPALKDKKQIVIPKSDDPSDPPPQPPVEPAPSQDYRNNTDIPLIVCGDFNSLADSSVYELMSMGRVDPDHEEIRKYQYGSFTRVGIEHPFSLRDAYTHLKGTPDEMAFTNYTPGFADVIDYLWYSTNTLEVVELLGPPDRQALQRIPAFPTYHFPADHIQIMAEFVIKARKDKKQLHAESEYGSGGGPSSRS
ncbi:Glucose-repressible alcohol dehydrogenase transcriptional effector [Ceratocystis lukuohia]|uniref:CCR4-Not complex 3'-5'-exoribonuclease subunit Ccr4 n=1 Tax=Ceratocystis lukuohia TaxID=2019550 RepID=A0ABR4MQM0_9PEZI